MSPISLMKISKNSPFAKFVTLERGPTVINDCTIRDHQRQGWSYGSLGAKVFSHIKIRHPLLANLRYNMGKSSMLHLQLHCSYCYRNTPYKPTRLFVKSNWRIDLHYNC